MMRKLIPAALLATGLLVSIPAAYASKEMQCTVNSVHDGDSMRVLCPAERGSLRVRMEQIDAPELEQAHGLRSRDHLRKLCRVGSTVIIRTQGSDQYGRLLGDVYCDGKSVNQEMVAAGAAWVYNKYVKDRTLYQAQDAAKREKRGLWAGKQPQAPWQWRYEQRQRN